METRLLGAQGAVNRMKELQARIEEMQPQATPSTVTPGTQSEFGKLMGTIGNKGALQPMNPFGIGMKVDGVDSPNELKPLIEQAANNAGIDPHLLDALVATESSYNPTARSGAGAMGLTQLMPNTAKSMGVTNPFDSLQNLNGGANYLSQMVKKYGGDIRLALAAYNAGPGAVDKYGGVPPYRETQHYVQKVLAQYEAKRSA